MDLTGKVIAFDADDTLWQNEINYRKAEREFAKVMLPFCKDEQQAIAYLMKVEGRNIPLLGYGSKTFIIALVESAMELSGHKADNRLIEKVIEIGKTTVSPKMELYPHVEEVLRKLGKSHRLVLATKGDLRDQQDKIRKSNLAGYFCHIEIMSEKDEENYLALIEKLGITPQRFVMVGNSFKSDIIPVLNIGASAIYIPSEIIWAHEKTEEFEDKNLLKQTSIKELI